MDIINQFFLGVWVPFFYIIYCIIFKKINNNKIFILFVFMLMMGLNWLYVGRIQNLHVIGLSLLAVYLYPPSIKSGRLLIVISIVFFLILVFNAYTKFQFKERGYILFGPNTDAALILMLATPLLYGFKNTNVIIFLGLALAVILTTQSRSAVIMAFPVLVLFIFGSCNFFTKELPLKYLKLISSFVFGLAAISIYLIYKTIDYIYLNNFFEGELRIAFSAYASDMDRLNAFLHAQEAFLSDFPSFLFGADILPYVTNASNVIHSEIYSVLFGGGVFIFGFVFWIFSRAFTMRNKFLIIFTFFYLISSGFSTSLFSFPFLYMLAAFLIKGNSPQEANDFNVRLIQVQIKGD